MEINIRPGTWDKSIFESVISGEYGRLGFQGKTVIDIGAHIGAFSILASLGGAGRVLAFEAGAENYGLLVKNCRKLAAVECHHGAVWRSDAGSGMVRWRKCANRENTGGGSVIDCVSKAGEPTPRGEFVEVRQIPFDDIVARVGEIDLLKIDAEGSEYPILFTSKRLEQVQVIVGEYHEIVGVEQAMAIPGFADWNIQRLVAHLESRGFSVAVLDKGRMGLFHAARIPASH